MSDTKKGVQTTTKSIERAVRRVRDQVLSKFGVVLHTKKRSSYADTYHKKLGPFRYRINKKDYTLLSYEKDGEFDYETYREIQEMANKNKIEEVFVSEENVAHMANFLKSHRTNMTFGLCHGTRRGLEQAWFAQHIGGDVEVLGTEISETATQFPNTVQWDFHEMNDDWRDRADFVYSNSWDHAYDPEKAFQNWISCLKVGGFLLLEHTEYQSPHHVMPSDPFGITRDGLIEFLKNMKKNGAGLSIEVLAPIEDLPNTTRNDSIVVVRRTG